MKSFNKNIQVTFLLLSMGFLSCFGQQIELVEGEKVEIGKIYKFHSDVLNEERELWVHLPQGYSSGTGNYPVIYELDAGPNGELFTAGLLSRLRSKSVPKSILIGVINTDRSRDFTPTTESEEEINGYPTAGGADNFIKMFEEELFPFVNNNFRTNEFNTIIGGSLSGLFVIYALAKKPDLFNAYLASSPSLWWNNQKVVDYFEKRLIANPEMKGLLYMTMGNEGTAIGWFERYGKGMMGGLMKLVGILESESPENLRWGYKIHPDESHMSNGMISRIEGLEFFYKDWFVLYPELEYLQYGIKSFEKRSKRIKEEFNVDWDLSNYQYTGIMLNLYEQGKFSECRDLGLSLITKGITSFTFLKTIGDAYRGLSDQENANKYYSEAFKSGPGHPGINMMMDSLGIDKQSLIPSIKLRTIDFELLAGEYVNSNNNIIVSISYAKDTISLVSPNGSGKLIPVAKNKAYWINSPITVEFYFDNETKAPASYFIIRYGDGETLRCTRKDILE